jgi:uncharacterized protein YuzE
MTPSAAYDADAHAVTVDLLDSPIVGTIAFPDDEHLVDVDESGRVVSLEILNPDDLKLDEIAERFGLAEILPQTESAIAAVLGPSTGVSAGGFTVLYAKIALAIPRGSERSERSASAGGPPAQEFDLIAG